MCGIAGFKGKISDPDSTIERMTQELYHRGPDGAGYFKSNDLFMGMRRLAINGLERGGQPLYNADQSIVVLYNGEIYNYKELLKLIDDPRFKFDERSSDGQVLPYLYEKYGEAFLERLDGMFAISLWDKRTETLLLARDIPGEKPLFYSQLPSGGVVYASEVKSILKCFDVSQELDYQAIWDYPTFLWIPPERTILRDVKELLPSHYLKLDRSGLKLRKYENRFIVNLPDSEDALIELTRTLVTEAVQGRLLSEVPVASFLSSGLDSSIVTMLARQKIKDLGTFTIAFENLSDPYHGKSDESVEAARFARELGTKHHTIAVKAQTFRELLDDFVYYSDQPFGVSSGLGILAISRAARELGYKVLLSGDGADECFGGYSWYAHLGLTAGRDQNISDDVNFQSTGLEVQKRLEALSGMPSALRAWAWHYYASEQEKNKLFNQERFEGISSSLRHFENYNSDEVWSNTQYIAQDRSFYMPFEMLRKVDRLTMANSIEGRVPFVAPRILKLAEHLRYEHVSRDGSLKWILRRAFADILPEHVVSRPKHGFNVPIDHWLKNEWADLVEETFSSDSLLAKFGICHKDSLNVAQKLIHDPMKLNGHSILCFITLNMWLKRFNYGNYR